MNKVIVDDAGNEIVIEMPKQEADELATLHANYLARKAALIKEEEEKNAARKIILDRLGITEDEARLLLS